MGYRQLTKDEQERFLLASERLAEIAAGGENREPLWEYFRREAAFLLEADALRKEIAAGSWENAPEERLEERNRKLYGELTGDAYAHCFGNPAYLRDVFGPETGGLLGALYTELRGAVVYAFDDRPWDLLILMELLLQMYCLYAQEETDSEPDAADGIDGNYAAAREILYWYTLDYCREITEERTRELLDPSLSPVRDRIMEADLRDLRYLYSFGEYVTETEKRTARFLNSLSEEEAEAAARIWTEGYRLGFEAQRKDIHIKKTVEIRSRLGFERLVRCAVRQFREMGLETVICRCAPHAVTRRQHIRNGWYGAVPNQQFEYDHRNDAALWLDERFVTEKLRSQQQAYEQFRQEAAVYGGPAVMETFGETPFSPAGGSCLLDLSEEQQQLQVRLMNESAQITNRYIRAEERSFTIIAWPVPAVGEQYEEIFREIIRINSLDYRTWQEIQQHLIDALDGGDRVRIRGRNGNETDLTVRLHPLRDPAHETNFENCVADVNIPVGEVFTSPLLTGTEGLLHVSSVYLEDFQYRDLRIRVEDGMISSYSCANFSSEEENRRYIEENILFHHPSVPMGEFAIGTNTAAYRTAEKYGIADRLPILIAEKMGPHFAFGDTCYSRQEDMPVFNPDGKEIIARDNERSLLRKTDPDRAYFGCHTDITIPYDELGYIRVLRPDGTEVSLIEDGRFVLPGTEALNRELI